MKITEDKINQLAHLCRLEFKNKERNAIKADLERILSFCNQLNEINTDGIEPLIYVNEHSNEFREDIVEDSLDKNKALSNAPSADSDYFKVPKVLRK